MSGGGGGMDGGGDVNLVGVGLVFWTPTTGVVGYTSTGRDVPIIVGGGMSDGEGGERGEDSFTA